MLYSTPERGEVAAFTDRTGEIYVRRVIAHEGETVEINGGTLYVNGLALDEPYLKSGAAEILDLIYPIICPVNVRMVSSIFRSPYMIRFFRGLISVRGARRSRPRSCRTPYGRAG